MTADPKPDGRRTIKDPRVAKLYAAANPECVSCGAPGSNAHHVLARGHGGDDVWPNLVTLCGSGTTGCHGAYHGSAVPATLLSPGRTSADVAASIGAHLIRRRHDAIGYIVGKIGPLSARHYLTSRYAIADVGLTMIPSPDPAAHAAALGDTMPP